MPWYIYDVNLPNNSHKIFVQKYLSYPQNCTTFAEHNNKHQYNFFIMAYVISDDCVACGTCISECPSEAISEGDIYHIDPNACVDCGTCADVCPSGAIHPGE